MSTLDFTPAFLLKNNVDKTRESGSSKTRVEPRVTTTPAVANEPGPDVTIPTLDAVAVPERHFDVDRPLLAPVLIGPERTGLALGGLPPEAHLSPEDIRAIAEKVRVALIPEIEKAVMQSMNHAFALAMDQASHVMRQKVQAKLNETLPKLVEDAIKRPVRKF